jgi:2,3-dihydroxybenzoate decarboxylase
MRIALEEHFVMDDPEHIERWLSLLPSGQRHALSGILPVLSDVGEQRVARLKSAGVTRAVLSNVGTVQGVLDPTPALRLARQANDYLARVVHDRADYYDGFATVPLQDPKAAVGELERAVRQLGLKGTMVFGHTQGIYLDDPMYDPFWSKLEELDVPLYLHASDGLIPPSVYHGRPELLGATWSWTAETAAHTLRLVFGGVFNRHPKARLILGHMGETLPFLLNRLDSRAKLGGVNLGSRPSEILRRNVCMTSAGAFSDQALRCAIDAFGAQSIMFSIDDCFENAAEAGHWADRVHLSAAERRAFEWENAQRILKL